MPGHPFESDDYIHAATPRPDAEVERGARAEFDLRVFNQSAYWKDETNTVYLLAEMDRHDRRALRAWLYRNAEHFYVQVLARELISTMRLTPGFVPRLTHQSSKQWMRDTPLMGALEGGVLAQIRRWLRSMS